MLERLSNRRKQAPMPKINLAPDSIFAQKKKEQYQKSNPQLNYVQILSLLKKDWLNLPESEKEEYETLAKLDKQRYDKEMETYKKENPSIEADEEEEEDAEYQSEEDNAEDDEDEEDSWEDCSGSED
eukprot:TRINITY_DN2711_c0_g1_i1.p1 TRINITY_DN2711_c0_g1~~TRINITY_DN2711_c0_g1_i1.p1  ORF type:complete len:127 (+),score=43.68 TRINITY_DN2711_c0_g1_i1:396-776(+)